MSFVVLDAERKASRVEKTHNEPTGRAAYGTRPHEHGGLEGAAPMGLSVFRGTLRATLGCVGWAYLGQCRRTSGGGIVVFRLTSNFKHGSHSLHVCHAFVSLHSVQNGDSPRTRRRKFRASGFRLCPEPENDRFTLHRVLRRVASLGRAANARSVRSHQAPSWAQAHSV